MQKHLFRWIYSFSLFDNYFETVYQINSENLIFNARRNVLLTQVFLFSFALFLTTVALFSDQLPALAHLALGNWFFFEGIPRGHTVWLVCLLYMLMYMNHLLYLDNDGVTFSVIYSIIASTDSSWVDQFFLQSHVHLFKRNISLVLLFRDRLLLLDNFFVVLCISLNYKFAQLGLFQLEAVNVLAYTSFLLIGPLYFITARLFIEQSHTFGFVVVLVGYAYRLKLEQVTAALVCAFLADFNRVYGRAMWALILVVYPQNAITWITLLLPRHRSSTLSPLIKCSLFTTGLTAIAFVGVVHYKAIYLTRRLGDCGRYMTLVAVHSKGIRQLKWKLKMERYISLFHSNRRPHTDTYGRYGDVTAQNFGRSIFYYIKLLLFVNKLFK
ncbi:hypothetical protein TYRP_003615 [Tyrophagus putrescentiae]|nr:hypothetical protein TYRP_003615 [Tyrophagus putrescentiae]